MSNVQDSKTAPVADAKEVTIRPATKDDFDAVLEMLTHLIRENPSGHSQEWPESGEARSVVAFHLDRGMALIAESAGKVIGHIGWRIGYARPPQVAVRYAEVESIYIHQDFRGQDVASRLVKGFLSDCERKAISVTKVSARPDEATIALFESCGFSEERRLMVRTAR